jgi:hypothetical protein
MFYSTATPAPYCTATTAIAASSQAPRLQRTAQVYEDSRVHCSVLRAYKERMLTVLL